jgi:serine O-acetyltransferase
MPHANGVIINERVRMGSNVRIFQHVTIGEWRGGAPSIGDGCSLYGGAKIFGPIEIGVHARIGPNCVVSDDVPAYHNVYLQPPLMVDRIGASKTAGSRGSIEPRGDE